MRDYKIVRTSRKTLAIYIRPDGEVEVRAPKRLSNEVIERAVRNREDWIREKQSVLQKQFKQRQDFSLTEGSRLMLLGEEFPVQFGENCAFDGTCFTVPEGDFETVRPQIIALYKKLAKAFISERVQKYVRQTGLTSQSIRINSAASRWGSCSGKNTLNFSWRLILAPLSAVDYVVVHELAHTREHNHSVRFWTLVESILPDYREREVLLKKLQKKLAQENWDTRTSEKQ